MGILADRWAENRNQRDRLIERGIELCPEYEGVFRGYWGGYIIERVPGWVEEGVPDDEIMDFVARRTAPASPFTPGDRPRTPPLRVQRAAVAYAGALRRDGDAQDGKARGHSQQLTGQDDANDATAELLNRAVVGQEASARQRWADSLRLLPACGLLDGLPESPEEHEAHLKVTRDLEAAAMAEVRELQARRAREVLPDSHPVASAPPDVMRAQNPLGKAQAARQQRHRERVREAKGLRRDDPESWTGAALAARFKVNERTIWKWLKEPGG